MPSRISGIGLSGIAHKVAGEARHRLGRHGGDAARRRLLQVAPERRDPRASTARLIHTAAGRRSAPTATPAIAATPRRVRKLPPIALRDLLDFRTEGAQPISVDEVESITEIRKRLVTPGMSLGALSARRRTRTLVDRHEPHRRAHRFGRGRRGSRRATKPRPNGDNATSAIKQIASGRFGVTAEYLNALPRDRDQGGAGRQARRGRAVARLQGDRADRQAAPFHPGGDADQPAAAPRHLLDRGSGAAHLRSEADQPGRHGLRQAGVAQRHRHDRGRRRQGQGRHYPDLRPCPAAPAPRRKAASNTPGCPGRWGCRRRIRC